MTAIRILLGLAGIWLAWYGIDLVLEQDPASLMSTAGWFVGGILLHDAILAPVCAVVALLARRLLPDGWWASIVWGGLCTVTLLLVAVPVVQRSGAVAGNPTILDRDYPVGLLVVIAVVWAFVGLDITRRHVRRKPQRQL
ncbi:hypothetical protein BJY24_004861 [Nocardia transvalensis]|uniref:Uncharacterized protein n=1 Tax=Nocardia transvalensis TaxID=37333 RepID=A0A7W9UK06_9NOCA|nr:hypothetical protein [Nocardia transvalensis]MBB5915949.1 hypothetical protein [Nocardia transvalensis]